MFFIYITLVLALISVVLWAMVSFNYVVQYQGRINMQWDKVCALIEQRDALLGDLQNLWVSPEAPAPDEHVHRLQELLAADAALHWQEVERRVQLRQQIEEQVLHLMSTAQNSPQLAQGNALADIQQQLIENGGILAEEATVYNRTVSTYNNLLTVNPNRIIAQKLGYAAAPLYAI